MRGDIFARQQEIDSPDTTRQAIRAASLTWEPQDYSNIAFPSPHVEDQLSYASPPIDDSYQNAYGYQNNYSAVGSVTLSVKVPGATITLGTFPQAQRVASVSFAANAALLSVDIIAAINNASANGEVGVYCARDVGPTIGLATSSDIYDGVLAPLGQFSKRSGSSFSSDIAPLIKFNTSIALYVVGYGANLATSSITVSCILRYMSIDG